MLDQGPSAAGSPAHVCGRARQRTGPGLYSPSLRLLRAIRNLSHRPMTPHSQAQGSGRFLTIRSSNQRRSMDSISSTTAVSGSISPASTRVRRAQARARKARGQSSGLIAAPFGRGRDLDGQAERHDDQRLAAIGANDQQVASVKPAVQLAEAAAPAFDLDDAIGAEQRHRDIADEASTDGAGKRDALRREAGGLQEAHQTAFVPGAFVATAPAAHAAPRTVRSTRNTRVTNGRKPMRRARLLMVATYTMRR